ncbi:MAG: TonB-dependent receptor [Novosphingobium sp.]
MAMGLIATPALAQDGAENSGGLGEIIVTAQRREENLQTVPISINAVTSESLNNLGIKDTNSLIQSVPSLNFTRSGPSGIFVIRGVSTPNGAAGEEGSTAVYIDDVYMPDLNQTVNKFNNIERIEVLNGPQGTLFGRNATGGAIRVITRDPGDRTEFNGQIGYANYETISGQAYLSTPLSDKAGFNIAFTGQDMGKGFGFNSTLNKRTKQDDYWSLRGKLVIKPTDTLKITLAGDYYSTNNDFALQLFPVSFSLPSGNTPGGVSTGPVAGQDTSAAFPSQTRIRAWGVSGKIELDLGFADLTSITSFRKLRNTSSFDVDGRAANIVTLEYFAPSSSFQQELRLSSATTDPLSWQFGAFYMHNVVEQDQYQRGLAFQGAQLHIVAKGATDSVSLFGEATYNITPSTHLTGGVRWTSDKRKLPIGYVDTILVSNGAILAHRTNPLTEKTFSEVTFRVALRQDIGEHANIYASVNRGFKAGQFNLQSPYDPPVNPVIIMAYEAGIKADLLDNRLRLNIAGFHYDISDYQVRTSAGNPPVSALFNAAKVKIDGVDINLEAAVTERLRLTAGMSYLNSRYSDFGSPGSGVFAPGSYITDRTWRQTATGPVLGAASGTALGGNATGNRTALSPEFTFNANVNYTLPVGDKGELRFTGGYSHKSRYYFEPDNVLSQPSYDVFNASIEYMHNDRIGIELFMKNIGDEQYNVQMVTAAGQSAIAAEPRTYGVNLKFKY